MVVELLFALRQRPGSLQVDWSTGVRATIRVSLTTPESIGTCQRPSAGSGSGNPDCSHHVFIDSELLEIEIVADSPRKEASRVAHNS
jgi:hypothetical protein